MVYIITLSPAIDNYLEIDELKFGQTNKSTSQRIVLGGKGINQSKLLKNLNFNDYQLISTKSKVHEKFILNELEGINHELFFVNTTRINTKINLKNEITEVNSSNATLKDDEFNKIYNHLNKNITEKDYLVVAGNVDSKTHKKIIKLLSNLKNITKNIVLDSSNVTLEELKIIKPLLIKPNIEELENLFETNIKESEIIEKLSMLNSLGVQNVLLSRGSLGAILSSETSLIEANVERQQIVNTVGAGDSMLAGYIYKHSAGFDDSECLKFATKCGSATAYSENIAKKSMINKVIVSIKEINEI